MTLSITHSTVATFADEPGAEINKAEWNDAHVITGTIEQSQNNVAVDGVTITGDGTPGNPLAAAGSSVSWGSITGTLSSQTDLQTALNAKVTANGAVTGATKTKLTYDAKGLVTAGADATTADIADSTNKRYVTDAQLTVIGNTSGTNTGDQTSIVGITGTKTQFDTACTDGNFLYVGDSAAPSGSAGGELAGSYPNPTLVNSSVTGKVLTGYVSGAGTVAATDTILQAIQKINGNDALKAPIASPTFTGTVSGITAAMVGAPSGSGTSTGTNTGDQTITLTGAVTGSGTGSFATTIATPGTVTVSSTNSNAAAHTHAVTSSSAPGAAASLLATDSSGHIGSTGTRLVKGWFTDLQVTNAIAGSITGNAATVTTNANLTGDVTSSGNTTAIGANKVTNAMLDTVATATFKGRTTAGTGNVENLTATQATALLNNFVGDSGAGGTKGLVPAPATGDSTKFLKGDGTWTTIPGGGDALTSNPLSQFASTTSAQLRGVLSDETGTGLAYFQGGDIGTPSAGVATNLTGTASGLTAGNATTLATTRSIYGNNFNGSAAIDSNITVTGNYYRFGPTTYAASSYPGGSNAYAIIDKSGTASDSSVVFRDQGNARAELGLIGDNDIHFKTASGTYPTETFTDRLLIRSTGQVDSFGTVLRQYATSGAPSIVAGNSNLSGSGAGLEMIYDFSATKGKINSVEWGNTYRPLDISANGINFYLGGASVSNTAGFSNTGILTTRGGITPAIGLGKMLALGATL